MCNPLKQSNLILITLFLCIWSSAEASILDGDKEPAWSLDSLIALNDKALSLKSNGSLSKAKSIYPVVLDGIEELLGKNTQAFVDVSVNYTRLLNELGDTYKSRGILAQLDSMITSDGLKLEKESLILLDYARAEAYLYEGKAQDALKDFYGIKDYYDTQRNVDKAIYANVLSGIAECYEIQDDFVRSKSNFQRAIRFAQSYQSIDEKINLENNYLEMTLKCDSLELANTIWQSIESQLADSVNNVIEYISYFNYLKLTQKSRLTINEDYAIKGLNIYRQLGQETLKNLSERQLNSFATRKFDNYKQALSALRESENDTIIELLYECHKISKNIVNRYYFKDYSEFSKPSIHADGAIKLDFFEIEPIDSTLEYGYFVLQNDQNIEIQSVEYQQDKSRPLDASAFQQYWEGIARQYSHKPIVRILPIGKLHQFNFQSYNNSIKTAFVITDNLEEPIQTDSISMFAVGGLYYTKDDTQTYQSNTSTERSRGYNYLPFTQREIDFLEQKTNDCSVLHLDSYSKSKAIETQVGHDLKDHSYDIIHFATHGFFDTPDRYDDFDEGFFKSGLVLSHPNKDTVENRDNILYGYEVKDLNLENTKLVFMSSCQSGVQEVNHGDNLYGLQEAFRRAGVDNIISTSDVVNDKISYQFSQSFYEQFLDHNHTMYESYRHALNQIYTNYGVDEASKFKFIGDGQIALSYSNVISNYIWLILIFLLLGVYLLCYRTIKEKIE